MLLNMPSLLFCPRYVLTFHPPSSTCTHDCKRSGWKRRTKGVINLKKKISDCWILLCSLSPAFVFSSKEHLWRPPGLFHWTLQAFMSDRSISLCCVLHIEHKRNQMWHCENRMFSLSMFHIPLFFFYYINNFGSNNYGWIKEMLSQN